MSMGDEEVRKAAEQWTSSEREFLTREVTVIELANHRINERTLAKWAAEELARRDAEAAERAMPLLGNVVPGFFDESDTWRVEHVITGVGKTAILLTDRRNGQQVRLGCIKTQGQLDYLLAALKGGEV